MLSQRCELEAMEGRFGTARKSVQRVKELYSELGLRLWAAGFAQNAETIEMLAGDPSAAEREFRSGYESLARMNEKPYLSTVAGQLSHALFEQGRYQEAEELAQESEEAAAEDDLITHVIWRRARAKIAATKGHTERQKRGGEKRSHWPPRLTGLTSRATPRWTLLP
jgi:tetratricopeptide (TPR) repeat protein